MNRGNADARADNGSRRDWPALASDIRAVGPRARIPRDRHRRHRSRRGRSAPASPGSTPAVTATMDYMARHGVAPRASRGARARHGARHHRAPELPGPPRARGRRRRARRSRERAYVSRYALGRDYHKVLRARLQRLAERIRDDVGPFGYRVFTDSAPVLEVALAAKSGPRLARQAHAAAHARRRLVVLPGRDLHRPAAAARRRREPRTAAPARPASTSARPGDRRAVRARRAALHLVSDDRARGQHPGGAAAADRQPHLRLRRLPARLPVEPVRAGRRARRISPCATASTTRDLVELFAWTEARIPSTHGGQRDPPHRLRALVAQSRGRPRQRAARGAAIVAALAARADDPSPLVREHVAWALARQRERATTAAPT